MSTSQMASVPLRVRQAQPVPAPQADLVAHFQPRLDALTGARPMTDADPFVAGLSVGEFFALSEDEQARLWNQAHVEAEPKIKPRERPVRPHALPARSIGRLRP
jgi:hypothetical protein